MMKNKKKKTKLARRITWRLTWIMLFVNVFVIALLLLFVIVVSEGQSKGTSQYITDGISQHLKAVLLSVETAARNNVAELEDHIDDPDKVVQVLEKELLVNPYFLGCFAAFEPDYYPSKGRWYEPYVKLEDKNHVKRMQIGSADHNYFEYDWYQKGLLIKDEEPGYLSNYYYDKDGAQAPISSYVLPIHDKKGRVIGVFGIDVKHDWLATTLANEEKKALERDGIEDEEQAPDAPDRYFSGIVVDGKGQLIGGTRHLPQETLDEILAQDSIDFSQYEIDDNLVFVSSQRLAPTDWKLIVVQHWTKVYFIGMALSVFIVFIIMAGILLIIFTTWRSVTRATKPLRYLTNSAHEVARGNFDTQLPTFKRNDEINQLRDSFEIMQQSLTKYVDELKKTTASKATMESELKIANGIQMSMLPKVDPPFPGRNDIDLYGSLKPAKAVGGDLYDFFISNEKLYFCIGDVSGKGVPASLVMAVTRTLFRNIASHQQDPSLIIKGMNQSVAVGNDGCMFVTVFLGELDIKTGRLRYCNAGHDNPYVGHSILPCRPNLPVGVDKDVDFVDQETIVPAGTTIFLYTDGLTEAENADHDFFGEQRVEDIINSLDAAATDPRQLIDKMSAAVSQFTDGTEQSDDLTMLAIRVRGER